MSPSTRCSLYAHSGELSNYFFKKIHRTNFRPQATVAELRHLRNAPKRLDPIQNTPDGETQDPEKARADAKRKTKLREIDHAKAIERSIDYVMAELAEDETNLLRSSLERSYEKVRADIAKELEDERRAIDADKADEDRIADLKDYTSGKDTAKGRRPQDKD